MRKKLLRLNPELFQGRKKRDNYFEGWYFKQVTNDKENSIAFIPGICLNKIDKHAFIQVILYSSKNQEKLYTKYLRFSFDDFYYQDTPFLVKIGKNIFSKQQIVIDILQDECVIKGELILSNITSINKSILSPNIMGLFGYVTFMECNHGVISMSHLCNGNIIVNGFDLLFRNGKGYIEKDWGKSFPTEYVWIQSNHFLNSNASIMLSVAKIPFLGLKFNGYIVNFHLDNKEYRFATYNFSKMKLIDISKKMVKYRFTKGKYILEVIGHAQIEASLVAPKDGKMDHEIKEGLFGEIEVKLLKDKKIIFDECGTSAGIEIVYQLKKSIN